MSVHALDEKPQELTDSQTRIDLAASLRLAVHLELEEGIDNHFTVTQPGYDDRYLILPFGYHWSEARASHMIVFDESGETLEGDGVVERTAQCIHAPIHRITGKPVVMHTHQTWAVALNMLEDNRLLPCTQTAGLLQKAIAYDHDYDGLATQLDEGERLASILGNKSIMFMKNHGVMVATDSIAKGLHLLYLLERACRTQLLAMATGQALAEIPAEVVERLQEVNPHDRHLGQRHALYFDAMKRVLDRENPGYAE